MKTISEKELIKSGIIAKETIQKSELHREIVKEVTSKLPLELGKRLIKEMEDPNYELGISRTAFNIEEDVFKNGYQLGGGRDIGFGIAMYDGNKLLLLQQCLHAHSYKNSKYVYVTKIPKNAIEYKEGETMPVLFPTDELNELCKRKVVLLSEYVLGYFENNDGKLSNLVDNPKYKETHEYMPDGLEYIDSAIYTYRDKNMPEKKLEDEEEYIEIEDKISEEYKEKHPMKDNAFIADVNHKKEIFSDKEKKAINKKGILETIKRFWNKITGKENIKYLEAHKQKSTEEVETKKAKE